MKKHLLFSNLVWILILFTSWSLSAQEYHFTEGFANSGDPDGWLTYEVSYSNGSSNAANMVDTLAAYCAKMKTDEAPSWLRSPKVIGAGTLTFWCKVKAPDITPSLTIQKSPDEETWTDVVTNPEGLDLANSSDFQNISVALNIEGAVFIRIVVSSVTPGSSGKGTITVDDLQLTKLPPAADDVMLATLTMGGEALTGFDPSVTNYSDTINKGWNYTITATPNNPNASVTVTQVSDIGGTEAERTATVVVTGEDGTSTATTTVIIFQNDYFCKTGFSNGSGLKGWQRGSVYQTSTIKVPAHDLYGGEQMIRFTGGHPGDANAEASQNPGYLLSPKLKNVGTLTFWTVAEEVFPEHELNVYIKKSATDSIKVKSIVGTELSLEWQEVKIEINNNTDSIQIRIEGICDINNESASRIWMDDFMLTSKPVGEVVTVQDNALGAYLVYLEVPGVTLDGEVYKLDPALTSNVTSLHLAKSSTDISMLSAAGVPYADVDIAAFPELVHFPALQQLNVSSNDLLTELDLSANTELIALHMNYAYVSELDLSTNLVLDTLNFRCAGAAKEASKVLTSIDLSKNTAIRSIQLRNHDLTPSAITGFATLTNLTSLDLHDNKNITAIDVSPFTKLEFLSLDGTGITETSDITGFNSTTSIKHLYLAETGLTSIDLSPFDLFSLSLDDTKIPNPAAITNFPAQTNLSYLNLEDLDFSGEIDLNFCKDSLRELILEGNEFSLDDIKGLNLLTQLTNLDLEDNRDGDGNNLIGPAIDISMYPNLERLVLERHTLTTIDVSNNPLLDRLDLRRGDIASLDNIVGFTALKNLTQVDLRDNPGADFVIPSDIFDNLSTAEGVTRGIPTNIKEIESSKMIIYPNPANVELSISNTDNAYQNLIIFSSTGQKVMQETLSPGQSRINIEHLRKGIYIASFSGTGGNYTTKLIKQ